MSLVIIDSNITEHLCSQITEFGDHRAHKRCGFRKNRIAHSNCCSQDLQATRTRGYASGILAFQHDRNQLKMSCILLATFLLGARLVSGSEVRLVGGKHSYEGRVEVKYDEEWRAVCDHGWNMKAADVVCRMLGFPDALRFTKG